MPNEISGLSTPARRMLPTIDEVRRPFWTGGSRGELLIQRCVRCRRWAHPPTERCPDCDGELAAEPVSGAGTVFTFTINRHAFHPDVPTPYVIAIVELVEQPDLRLVTNIVGCAPEDVRIGLPVQVDFERQDDVLIPVFRQRDDGDAAG